VIEGSFAVANGDRDKPRTSEAPRIARKRVIPTNAANPQYADDLGQYLDQLLDEALKETFPASDSLAVPTRRELEKK
jgi:hypothetical protein